jgi:hypothetical protein
MEGWKELSPALIRGSCPQPNLSGDLAGAIPVNEGGSDIMAQTPPAQSSERPGGFLRNVGLLLQYYVAELNLP